MTAVLAAVARAVLGAVLLLAAVGAVLWPGPGLQGPWTPLWLAARFAVAVAALLGLDAILARSAPQPENERGGNR